MMVDRFYFDSTVLGQNEKVCKNECKRTKVSLPYGEDDSNIRCSSVGFQ